MPELSRRLSSLRFLRNTIVTAVALSCACANLLDLPDAPVVVPDDPWTCTAPTAQAGAPMKTTARVSVYACDFVSTNCGTPVTGLTAQLCDRRDVKCASPIFSGIHDSNGNLTFDVPTGGPLGSGFDGYLLVNSPMELCTNEAVFGGPGACVATAKCDTSAPDEKCNVSIYVPALQFFNPPVHTDLTDAMVLPLLPTLAARNLLTAGGGQILQDVMTLGVVVATAVDCNGVPVAGVTFESAPIARQGSSYLVDGAVSAAATSTDPSGIGGLIGIPEGYAQITAFVPVATGRRKIADTWVRVAANAATYVSLSPQAQ